MMKETYSVIADEKELEWFFNHVIQKPNINESYLACFVCRHKKLTDEEKLTIGLSRRNAEFLAHQSFRLNSKQEWKFRNFLQTLKRFEVNKEAYVTENDLPLPEKCLVTLFYVNPSDDIKVCERFVAEYNENCEAIIKAHMAQKDIPSCLTGYRWFTNASNRIKHLQANVKGTKHWTDYDIDVPIWWKSDMEVYQGMLSIIEKHYKKGTYVIIKTTGGYHVLVRCSAIKTDPHNLCKDMTEFYEMLVKTKNKPRYLDDNGVEKFECILNDSQIPGVPLPGTVQYNNLVTVLNKEDFNE